jgi:phosphoribosyl 1,2-cyclic phosphodiesterase
MRVRFWGVRGSIAWATDSSIRHGCNTPCIEVRDEKTGEILVLDAGSGLVGFSKTLDAGQRAAPILLSHYHWDHVQGLPFFPPFFKPESAPAIWAPVLGHGDRGWLETMFKTPFFPIPVDRLPSTPHITFVNPPEITIGSFHVRVHPLTHPGGAFAYRVRGSSGDLVYATDHEFGDSAIDEGLAAFCFNAGAAILDAHYTPEEYQLTRGYGHSTWRQCAEFASATGAGHLYLFHHKPGRTDAELDDIERAARKVFPATSAAREGHEFTL